MARVTIIIDAELCNGCGDCVEYCPNGGLAMQDGKAIVLDPERCGECYYCESICPTSAIRVVQNRD